ncbi:MAG TPA: PhoH family protein [Flavobacteriaceae bacterium]|nr:PhoH family protein [Flavobacteriaceae bacterium]
MNEIILELSDINPREFFGLQNNNIKLLKKYFPKLKIVARGNKIKAFGEEKLLMDLEESFYELVAHYEKYNKLDESNIEHILSSEHKRDYQTSDYSGEVLLHGVGGRLIKAQTVNQRKLVDLSQKNDMVFAVGPAGTGKTYTSVALAVRALKEKQVKRIILTRPAVEAGENLGFLPGDMREKLDPYMQPLYDALFDMIPVERLETLIERGIIQIAPLAFMRGRTLDNAFVILDEAQNTSTAQMKMFLTRMGRSAKFIVTGDPGQVDLPARKTSGLKEIIGVLKKVSGIGFVFLDDKDVIRHKLVKKIIDSYKELEKSKKEERERKRKIKAAEKEKK